MEMDSVPVMMPLNPSMPTAEIEKTCSGLCKAVELMLMMPESGSRFMPSGRDMPLL